MGDDDDDGWAASGACRGMPPKLFYPESGVGLDNSGTDAKRICLDCPVRGRCLDHAVRKPEEFGIWGGVGEDRRRYVRRQYLLSITSRDPWVYRNALAEEENEIGRAFGVHDEERPFTEQHRCPSCHEWVPAGRHPVNRNGPAARCGIVSTYNKGCRCRLCSWEKSRHQQQQRSSRVEDPAATRVAGSGPDEAGNSKEKTS